MACLLAGACGDFAEPPPAPAHLRVVQGDGQTGDVGAPLLRPVVFAVTDGSDRPLPGVEVTLAVVAGGGTVPAAETRTGPDGSAATDWILGTAEEPQILEARAEGLVLRSGVSDAFRDVVYRSTFVVDEAGEYVTFWFSGASFATGDYVWQAATETRRVADVLGDVTEPAMERLAARAGLTPPEPADMPVRQPGG
jgi:hypothetical protein